MIRLKSPVIVEGKYDKITLENIIDALIIPTNGFAIFKDKDKCQMIRALGERYGIIVITDSDSAGNMIRAYIKNIACNCKITNVYIPQIRGKEKRKTKGGKEGLLGVEGIPKQVLTDILLKYGVECLETKERGKKITKTDLFSKGLSGRENSSQLRREFLKSADLPQNLSTNAMLDVLNTIMSYEEFCEVTDNWLKDRTKS